MRAGHDRGQCAPKRFFKVACTFSHSEWFGRSEAIGIGVRADRGVSPPLKTLPLRPGNYNIEVRNGDLKVYRQRVTVQDSRSAPVVVHEFK